MIARFMSFYKPGVTLRYLLERGSYLPRYKQREADNSGTPLELLLAHSLAYSLQDSSKVDSPLLLLLSKVCCLVMGEGGSFYSPRRSVPARNKYGNTGHRLQEDKDDLPAKDKAEWRQHGPADPVVRPAHRCRLSRRLSSWTLPGAPPTCVCRCRGFVHQFSMSNGPLLDV